MTVYSDSKDGPLSYWTDHFGSRPSTFGWIVHYRVTASFHRLGPSTLDLIRFRQRFRRGHGHRFGHEFGHGLGHGLGQVKNFNFGRGFGHGHEIFLNFGHGLGHGLGQSHDFGHGHGFGQGHVRKPRTRTRTRTNIGHACPLISVVGIDS